MEQNWQRFAFPNSAFSTFSQPEIESLLAAVEYHGREILRRNRGLMSLLKFSEQLFDAIGVRLHIRRGHISEAVKSLLIELNSPHLKLQAPSSMVGVGIVFNSTDPDCRPTVKTS